MAESAVKKTTSSSKKTATAIPVKKTALAKTPAATPRTAKTLTSAAAAKKVAAQPTITKPATKKPATTQPADKKPAAKPAVAKPAATRSKPAKAAAPKTGMSNMPITPEQRYQMIATAAYFLAERRGFTSGNEMQDWITAEAQINAQLLA
jgi:hypothetical protein